MQIRENQAEHRMERTTSPEVKLDTATPPDPRFAGSPGDARDNIFYRRMLSIRRFEETLLDLFDEGVLHGTTHCCIGQEANCVAVMEHLSEEDHVFSNHRCHGHYLARTWDALGLLAEIMGKRAGICGGLGGSQHICAAGFKSSGVLGGTVPVAAGIALARQLRGSDALSVAFIGDGTLGEGVVYETLNIASLWQLPLLVVCENNEWSQSTPRASNMHGDLRDRFAAFGLPVREIATTDVLEIDQAAEEVVAAVRKTGRPHALLIHTYRLCHHSKNDDNRPQEEVQRRWEVEPLVVHGRRIAAEVREGIREEVDRAIEELVRSARSLT